MKRKITNKDNINNLFRAMSYELAGDIGVIDNEDMLNNRKIINTESSVKMNKNTKTKL